MKNEWTEFDVPAAVGKPEKAVLIKALADDQKLKSRWEEAQGWRAECSLWHLWSALQGEDSGLLHQQQLKLRLEDSEARQWRTKCLLWRLSISKTPRYILVLVAYLIILRAIQADLRESPRTVQVDYTLLGRYLYKWDFLVQARSANFLLTFWPFSVLISGQYPEKDTEVSSSNINKIQALSKESNN